MPFASGPPKMSITNLTSGVTIEPQYNPATFNEEVGAVYAKQVVPGLSHQVKQYTHTEDLTLNLTLAFDCTSVGPQGYEDNLAARRFLMSAVYPRAGSGSVATAGAPRMLLVWPGLLALTCVLTKVRFEYQRFNLDGGLVAFTAALTIEEIRDTLITMEDVEDVGSLRTSSEQEGAK